MEFSGIRGGRVSDRQADPRKTVLPGAEKGSNAYRSLRATLQGTGALILRRWPIAPSKNRGVSFDGVEEMGRVLVDLFLELNVVEIRRSFSGAAGVRFGV